MTERRHRDAIACTTRRAYSMLAVGFILFAVYGSLLPFELQPVSPSTAWREFKSAAVTVPEGRVSRSDVLANILLFVPIGFTLAGTMLGERWAWRRFVSTIPLIVLCSVAVSTAAEFLQLFFSERVSSGLDIAAQTVGTLGGIAAWLIAGDVVSRWAAAALANRETNRASRLLTAYTVAWVFVGLAPLDITVDAGDLAERWRTGRVSLFGLPGNGLNGRFMWDALAEVSSAIPLGVWALWSTARRGVPHLGSAIGLLLIVAMEVVQIFIESHSASGLDVLLGCVGVVVGSHLARRLDVGALAGRTDGAPHLSPLLGAAVMLVVALNCLYYWQPYDFGVDTALIRSKLSRISLLPFAMFLSGSYLSAFNNLLVSVALSVPLGFAAELALRHLRFDSRATMMIVLVAAIAVYGVIECGQFFLPTRTPDPTDVLVGAIGAVTGAWAGRSLLASPLEK